MMPLKSAAALSTCRFMRCAVSPRAFGFTELLVRHFASRTRKPKYLPLPPLLPPPKPEYFSYTSFYAYRALEDVDGVRNKLLQLWQPLGILGRIYVAQEGINAQMMVPSTNWDSFLQTMADCPELGVNEVIKGETIIVMSKRLELEQAVLEPEVTELVTAEGQAEASRVVAGNSARFKLPQQPPFSKLQIKIRNKLVNDGLQQDLEMAMEEDGAVGQRLHPSDWHHRLLRHSHAKNDSHPFTSTTPPSIPTTAQSGFQSLQSPQSHSPPPSPPPPSQPPSSQASSSQSPPSQSPRSLVIDCRNYYESDIGHFQHAFRPQVATFRDMLGAVSEYLENQQASPSSTELFIYCTGGIRCERVGAYLKQKLGYHSVNSLRGGINAYWRWLSSQSLSSTTTSTTSVAIPISSSSSPSSISTSSASVTTSPSPRQPAQLTSLFKGKNFVFDQRIREGNAGERITDDILSTCHLCGVSSDEHTNCELKVCDALFIVCPRCRADLKGCCSEQCLESKLEWEAKASQGEILPSIPKGKFRPIPGLRRAGYPLEVQS